MSEGKSAGETTRSEINPAGRGELERLEQQVDRLTRELEACEAKLELAQIQLVEQAGLVALGQLFAGVAHELKNPANFIYGGSVALMECIESLWSAEDAAAKAKLLKLAAVIKTGGERIKDVTDSLDAFRGRGGNGAETFLVAPTIHSTVALLESQAKRRGIKMVVSAEPELKLRGNQSELCRVLANLILNALQASSRGEEVRITALARDDEVRIEIRDHGPGIPEQAVEKIFEPFYTTKKPGDGTGLGLSISDDIVRKHGGRIEVSSEKGGGATFTAVLPRNGKIESKHE